MGVDARITGEVVSCTKCELGKYPHLRSFLLDGDVEFYKGIHTRQESGRVSVDLIVYDEDEEEMDRIDLREFDTKEEIHVKFQELGFEKKDDETIVRLLQGRTPDAYAYVKERAVKKLEEEHDEKRERKARKLERLKQKWAAEEGEEAAAAEAEAGEQKAKVEL